VIDRGQVVRRLARVTDRDSRRLICLKEEEVRQRGNGALDLRGEDSLLAYVGVNELIRVGQKECDAVKPAESLVCLLQEPLKVRPQRQRRVGRQWRREERRVALLLDSLVSDPALSLNNSGDD